MEGAGEWDETLRSLTSPAPLLQSWGYGEVQAGEGWAVERLALPAGGRATVLLRGRGGFRRAYVPRGPVPATQASVSDLVEWARELGLARLRLEPEAPVEFGRELRLLGFRPTRPMHPAQTSVVPLRDDEQLMASFKPKHRYNIRLALKRGIQVEEGADAGELYRQHVATARRQRISAPSARHFQARLDHLEWCRTYVARHDGRPLAAIMVARFAHRAYYLFGGSSGELRQMMPTYAVQWEAMRAAARAGCRDYDLWGMPPENDPDHPWHGLWQFKAGFNGTLVDLCGAWDLELAAFRTRAGDLADRVARAGRRVLLVGARRPQGRGSPLHVLERGWGRGASPARADRPSPTPLYPAPP